MNYNRKLTYWTETNTAKFGSLCHLRRLWTKFLDVSTNVSTPLLNNHTADQCRQINREEVLSRSLGDRNIVPSANKLCIEWTSANSTGGAGWGMLTLTKIANATVLDELCSLLQLKWVSATNNYETNCDPSGTVWHTLCVALDGG